MLTLPFSTLARILSVARAHEATENPSDKFADNPICQGVSTDSRTIRPGEIFIALLGARADGAAFIEDALAKGAGAVITSARLPDALPRAHPRVLSVANVYAALYRLMMFWRTQCPARIIAITGSNGKTTTKDMLTAILATTYRTHATTGNFNNELGVPLTVLAMPADTEYAIVEIGARRGADIAFLARMLCPDIGFITNIGNAHVGIFGSSTALVAAKEELLVHSQARLLDDSAPHYRHWEGVRLAYGSPKATDRARNVKLRWSYRQGVATYAILQACKTRRFEVALANKAYAHNAAWAMLAAYEAGVVPDAMREGMANWCRENERRVASTSPMANRGGRLRILRVGAHTVIDDTYNASPESVRAALAVLARYSHPRWLVLGALAELGAASLDHHRRIGTMARRYGVSALFAIGADARAAEGAFMHGFMHGGTGQRLPQNATEDSYSHALRQADITNHKGNSAHNRTIRRHDERYHNDPRKSHDDNAHDSHQRCFMYAENSAAMMPMLRAHLTSQGAAPHTILIKGSRYHHLERLIDHLTHHCS